MTASGARLAVIAGQGENRSVLFLKAVELPSGLVNESYATQNITDTGQVVDILRENLSGMASLQLRRAALSLPDSVFRVQILEFEELPAKAADRERLIRWRLEKSAFDITDTVLRYQVLEQQDKAFTILACIAKQPVIAQYESILARLGLEPWSVGISSFYAWNFYSSHVSKACAVSALAHMSEGSFATIITEAGGVRFYRYKDAKRGSPDEIKEKLMREIDDSLHFYVHMDRSHQTGVDRLYFTGDAAVSRGLAEKLKAMTSLDVEIPVPGLIIPSAGAAGPEMAAALGAVWSL